MWIDVVIWTQPRRTHNRQPHVDEGDILGARLAGSGIGRAEGRLDLWLRMDVPDRRWQTWGEPLTDGVDEDGIDIVVEKRRFFISLDDLNIEHPSMSLSRSRDPDDRYQPLLPSREDAPHLFEGPITQVRFQIVQEKQVR